MTSSDRLNRYLARRGVASRRGADALIAAGRVSVNGRPGEIGATVDPDLDRVAVDGRPVGAKPVAVTIALNKPPGVVTTVHDPQGRPTVVEIVPPYPGLVPVGRLDADSRGLLLLSSDGDLVHRVTHPRHGLPKRYAVTLAEPVDDSTMRRLRDGVRLEDGVARPLRLRRLGRTRNRIEMTMGEGRKREVRRMLLAVGATVVDLCRVAVGPIDLGDLPEGGSRPLDPDELAALYAAAGLPLPEGAE